MKIEDIAVKVEGVWLPKHEKHLLEWMTKSKGAFRKDDVITYQWSKQQYAMDAMREYIPDFAERVFVDVGAHVGLWSMWWTPIMHMTYAYEPIPEMRVIYEENMKGRGKYRLHSAALSDAPGNFTLVFNPENTGNTHAARLPKEEVGTRSIPAVKTTLDLELDIDPGLLKMGVLKIDTEGFEEKVVRGGSNLIRTTRPLIIVEQKKGAAYYGASPTGAVDLLKSWGYWVLREMSGDFVMVHESQMK